MNAARLATSRSASGTICMQFMSDLFMQSTDLHMGMSVFICHSLWTVQQGVTALIEPISVIPDYFLKHLDQGKPHLTLPPLAHGPYLSSPCPWPARGILDEVSSPNLQLQMDIFHTQRMDGNITQRLADNMDVIGMLQPRNSSHSNTPKLKHALYGLCHSTHRAHTGGPSAWTA